jgi:hypothetical protein
VGIPSSGRPHANGNSPSQATRPPAQETPRTPRRIVLLADGEASAVQQVLVEYPGDKVAAAPMTEDLHRCAAQHRGQYVAVEWLGPLGWTRFLWCRE